MNSAPQSVVLAAGKNLLDFLLDKEPRWPLERLLEEEVKQRIGLGFISAVGLPQTASLFTQRLGVEIKVARDPQILKPGQEVIVGEYDRTRCDEAAESFPLDAGIDWFLIKCLERINYHPPINEAEATHKEPDTQVT